MSEAIRYGFVRKANQENKYLIKPIGDNKFVLVKGCKNWLSIGDKIPYIITEHSRRTLDFGRFVDKTYNGSIVTVGYTFSDYERDAGKPEGMFFYALGFGDLFRAVDKALDDSFLTEDENSILSEPDTFFDFHYIWGHHPEQYHLETCLSDLLERFLIQVGPERKSDFFIDFTSIKTDKKRIKQDKELKQVFGANVWKILKAHLLA